MERKIRLVIDTNILFAATISPEGHTARLIFRDDLELYAPDFMLWEIEKYKKILLRKGAYETAVALDGVLSKILKRVTIIPGQLYVDIMPKAAEITPDPKDAPFIALALKLNAPLWTNDKALKAIEEIQVLDTREIIELVKER